MGSSSIDRLNTALSGRYHIERELGHGGMAIVYLARDEKHGRQVALKVLRAGFDDERAAERFAREIEIAARMNHPNILPLHDSGEADGLLYFVMPYVEGESLRARLEREGPMELDVATRIVREVGGGLAYAHEQGLVHRDIKPENVLFQAGHALICDFGIAKAANPATSPLTQAGLAIGTLTYMSPEQLTGDTTIDGRSDVYSLGCLLFEMLAGAPTFHGASEKGLLARKLMGEVPDICAARPDVPPTVRGVIARSLALAVGDRFSTADEMVAALDQATTRVAIERDSTRRRRTRVMQALLGLALASTLGVVAWWVAASFDQPAFQRVAVLPLTSPTDDSTQDFFVQGVHEDLVLELQRAGVRVINPSSVRRFAGSSATVREIADDLGVDAVIQGSANLIGQRLSLRLFLTDAETEELGWVEEFGSDERDVLGLIRNAARSIAAEVGVELTAEAAARLAEAPQVDPLVYEALLQARYETYSLTEAGLDRAADYYRLALARDSLTVEAWTGLAQVWNVRAQQGLVSQAEAGDSARPYLARAAAIDPALGQDYAAQALRLTWPEWPDGRWGEAEEAFRKALERDPSDAVTRAYFALFLLYQGRTAEGSEETDRAAGQAPDNVLVQGLHGQALNALHRWDEAEAALTRARRFDADAPILLSTLRTVYHLQGEHELAIRMWRDTFAAGSDDESRENLEALNRGYQQGGYSAALRAVAEVYVDRAQTRRVPPWQIGTLYTRAGMPDEALTYLEAAVREGDPNSPYLTVDAIFDPLRSDPRFQALIDRLGLPAPSSRTQPLPP